MIHLVTTQPQEFQLIIGGKTEPMRELTWFVICVGFRAEYRVCQALTEARFERYCPSERKMITHGRKREPRDYPLFPGYVFVGLEAVAHGPNGPEFPFDAIKAMEDVGGFVAFGGRPRPVAYDAQEPSGVKPRARSLAEIRAMEESGAFDHTINAQAAAANIRKAKRTIRGLQEGLAEHSLAPGKAA